MTPETYQAINANLKGLLKEEQAKLFEIYKEAAKAAGKVVEDALERGLSELTSDRWQVIKDQLEDMALKIADATDESVRRLVSNGYNYTASLQKNFIIGGMKAAGVEHLFSIGQINASFTAVNESLIRATVTRIYKDGYNYSDRIWSGLKDLKGRPIGVYGDWLEKIKNIVSGGIAQGIDPAQIARDIYDATVSTAGAQKFVIGRWGKLKPGTREYVTRLGRAGIDYRALRIIRSELYRGLHDAALMNGQRNPAATGMYNWILNGSREKWPCACDHLAKSGPYEYSKIPGYPHPNCMCIVEPVLYSRSEYVKMLQDYRDGSLTSGADKIRKWASEYGFAA